MCLENISKKKIAEHDIVCYKRLLYRKMEISNGIKHGDRFTAVIMGVKCRGKISICGEDVFLCTNNNKCSSWNIDDKQGYKFSWYVDYHVTSITVGGKEIRNKLMTPYRDALIEIGEEYVSGLIKKGATVNIGLHSFKHEIDAKRDGGGVYAECIIPKGAEYYEGNFHESECYASNRLKYVKLIE